MKFIIVSLLLSASFGCKEAPPPTEQQQRQAAADQKAQTRARADEIAGKIFYVREARSGLCFAYYWESYGSYDAQVGGPALATVDCAKVADALANGPVPAEAPPQTKTAP